ncbi:hypothetical protein ACFX19_026108 [Malus domestica]
MPKSECVDFSSTNFEFIFSLKDHRDINFSALTVDLHADFLVLFTSNLDFRPVWDPGYALAQAVKLMFYFQCKEGKHMDNLFDVQRLLYLLAVSRNIRRPLLAVSLVEQLGCLAIQLHCSDFNWETNNAENWSKEHDGANITVAIVLIVCPNVPGGEVPGGSIGQSLKKPKAVGPKGTVNLLQIFIELDDHFLMASESAHDSSKMLEAPRLH